MSQKLPLEGKTLKDATALVEEAGGSVRVTRRDGVAYVVTCDYRTDRYNLYLVDGKVTGYTVG